MARAALLNLKGTQYQGAGISPTLSDITLGSLQTAASPNLELAFNQLGLGQSGLLFCKKTRQNLDFVKKKESNHFNIKL